MKKTISTGIIFGMIFLASCFEKDEFKRENSALISRFPGYSAFSQVVPFDFEVKWNAATKQYSEDLGFSYFEFPVIGIDGVRSMVKGNYKVYFSLLAVQKAENAYDFFVVKFYDENRDGSLTDKVSFSDSPGFSGLMHLLNKNNEMIFAKKLKNGVVLDRHLFKDESSGRSHEAGRMGMDCYDVPVYHYTDWYVNGIYVDSYLEYVSYSRECDSFGGFLPGLYLSGGGGSGSYYSGTGGGAYDDCGDPVHGCLFKLEDRIAGLSDENIEDELSDPCLKNMLSEIRNKNLANDITRILYETFGKSDIVNVTFMEDPTIANPYTTGTNNAPYIFVEIYLNPINLSNASKEYVAETMFHEIIHAYLNVEGKVKGDLEQHIEMARNYVDRERIAMREIFPNLSEKDANALILGGFGQLQAQKPDYFNELLSHYNLDVNTTAAINNNYKLGNVGTDCN